MKNIKKILVTLVVSLLLVSMAGCSSSPSADGGSEKPVKIGVLVADATGEEALAFRSYYEDYIQKNFNVEFMYSDELSDAAAEASTIDNFVANNCKAIISFASADRAAQIEKCEENKVYYAVATGTLSDAEYEQFKSYEYYVGAIGPDLTTEFLAGYDMAKYYIDNGATKFAMFGGATPYFNDMHIYRAAGMLAAMAEAAGTDYKGANSFAIVGQIYADMCAIEPYDFGSVKLVGYVGGYDFDDAWFGKLAETASNPEVEVLLAVGSGETAFGAFKQEGQKLGNFDSYTAAQVGLVQAGTIDYLTGKFSASIGPIFAATLSAVKGQPIRTNEGYALALGQGYWVATSVEEANKYYEVCASTTEPAYTKEMLEGLIGASYDDFAKFVSAYSFEDISNIK